MVVLYDFGDASGSGFGSTILSPGGIRYRFGLWGRDLSHQSSNYRELRNLVNAVDYEVEDQFPILSTVVTCVSAEVLANPDSAMELFLFTDNTVAEGAFYRGASSNPRLFELVLRLRQLELPHSLQLHIVHVAGQRMIAQGTDGLSRGDLLDGIMRGQLFLHFVPLHLGAAERYPGVVEWCKSWCPTFHLLTLSPYDWYVRGHGITGNSHNADGVWVPSTSCSNSIILLWTPAPTLGANASTNLPISPST
jgi:hypothetical protein